MSKMLADTAVCLRADEFVEAVPSGGRQTWPVFGRKVWVPHRELMVVLYAAGVYELVSRELVELVDYDGSIGVVPAHDLDALLDGDAAPIAQPFSCARDFRSGISRQLERNKQISGKVVAAIGFRSSDLTVFECARWGGIHAVSDRDTLRRRTPHRQLERLGVLVDRRKTEKLGAMAKLKRIAKGTSPHVATIDDFVVDDAVLAGFAPQVDALTAELGAWLETTDGQQVRTACEEAIDSPRPGRHDGTEPY